MSKTINSPVPIVDFGLFLHGNDEDKRNVAAQIDDAFRTVGFVCLVNHGIDQEKVDTCFQWSKKFFALPTETKQLAPHPPGGMHHRGYSGISQEKVSQNVFDADGIAAVRAIPDVKESFESGNVDDAMQPNIWLPEDALPGFRGFMENFFEDCASLIHSLLDTLSLALSLPQTVNLPATHAHSLFQLRLLHYPPVPLRALLNNEKTRIAAHSDFGTLTLLFQDRVGGLEIEVPAPDNAGGSGVFKPVPHVQGGVLVNVGDLMMRWSNDRWRSTVHRVRAPPSAAAGATGDGGECPSRYSIPFFATADQDARIECLPGCWGEGRPKRYAPVTAGEYVQMRMAALYE